ncbi:hypothetical protein AN958_03617 [Leucoagaricus sp. SymC.cos]|nr:hypothetical protein AN958_03617 [Leucoagaricus sp. SymC.cos]
MARTDIRRPSPDSSHNHGSAHLTGDGKQIRGNSSEKLKALAHTIFFHFIDAKGKSFGADVGRRLKFTEINISGFEDSALSGDSGLGLGKKRQSGNKVSVETVFEMMVDRDMCNVHGTLHGGCAAYLVDPCSSAPLVVLGLLLELDGTGVSQSMNLIWHRPVHTGAKITIKSTSMYITGKVRTARCEIWTGNKLCVSAIHSTINPREPKAKL